MGGAGRMEDRSYDHAYRCLLSLQSSGAQLEAAAENRHKMMQCMHHYMARLRLVIADLPILHVAGTKGKGSTSAFAESILRACGYRTGALATAAAAAASVAGIPPQRAHADPLRCAAALTQACSPPPTSCTSRNGSGWMVSP